MSACRSCGAKIVWARTPAGKRAPIDAQTAVDGNVRLSTNGAEVTARTLGGAELELARSEGVALHLSHFATCPDREDWKT